MDASNGEGESALRRRVALLVDGENISHALAGQILTRALRHGDVMVMRAYGNAAQLPGWDKAARFRLIHSGTGKNATDILLTVEAMALAYGGLVDYFCIASSDRDYTHLVQHLREKGHAVIGIGEDKADPCYRKVFSKWEAVGLPVAVAPPPSAPPARTPAPPVAKAAATTLDDQIAEVLRAEGGALEIARLGARMHAMHQVRISTRPERTWRAYLLARTDFFVCDPRGPDAKVRLRA